ncbi:hypothetical protein GNI_016470 [Gregarina niphandrodes]|uniref:Uncharacterized protein n=1 Tax=Gregarina niphandrodes TaxID=110365 RepID=A0A023BC98_GRENI|nr:hypothetical protein GNI_016470 [Gregarina niphandrodes]EZG82422.1 hypothetical protein GNI_016470 [Gregarina niphandrodes]|eukprot:XP_011128991.1 hypothetical protein GNI_016470 [Gregarina niphandrodes]
MELQRKLIALGPLNHIADYLMAQKKRSFLKDERAWFDAAPVLCMLCSLEQIYLNNKSQKSEQQQQSWSLVTGSDAETPMSTPVSGPTSTDTASGTRNMGSAGDAGRSIAEILYTVNLLELFRKLVGLQPELSRLFTTTQMEGTTFLFGHLPAVTFLLQELSVDNAEVDLAILRLVDHIHQSNRLCTADMQHMNRAMTKATELLVFSSKGPIKDLRLYVEELTAAAYLCSISAQCLVSKAETCRTKTSTTEVCVEETAIKGAILDSLYKLITLVIRASYRPEVLETVADLLAADGQDLTQSQDEGTVTTMKSAATTAATIICERLETIGQVVISCLCENEAGGMDVRGDQPSETAINLALGAKLFFSEAFVPFMSGLQIGISKLQQHDPELGSLTYFTGPLGFLCENLMPHVKVNNSQEAQQVIGFFVHCLSLLQVCRPQGSATATTAGTVDDATAADLAPGMGMIEQSMTEQHNISTAGSEINCEEAVSQLEFLVASMCGLSLYVMVEYGMPNEATTAMSLIQIYLASLPCYKSWTEEREELARVLLLWVAAAGISDRKPPFDVKRPSTALLMSVLQTAIADGCSFGLASFGPVILTEAARGIIENFQDAEHDVVAAELGLEEVCKQASRLALGPNQAAIIDSLRSRAPELIQDYIQCFEVLGSWA